MDASLASLPSELMALILANVPLTSLLSFSATSRTNRALAGHLIQELNLAVFVKDIHARLALMAHEGDPLRFSVVKTTNLSTGKAVKTSHPATMLRKQISAQNKTAAEVLGHDIMQNIRSLSLLMYELDSQELASIMASNLPKLRHLELRFYHQYVHDRSLSANYWREAPEGSPCWNALVGLGNDNQQKLRLRNLQSLKIQRAGLTSVQLRKFIESNPQLMKLHLENVTGVDLDFVQWLGTYCESENSKLEEIILECCAQLKMQKIEDFAWLTGITESSVKHLSLYKCMNVRHQMFVDLIEDDDGEEGLDLSTLERIVPPRGPARRFGVVEDAAPKPLPVLMQTGVEGVDEQIKEMEKIEVDPDFMIPMTMAAT